MSGCFEYYEEQCVLPLKQVNERISQMTGKPLSGNRTVDHHYVIIDGPSKYDIMLALFDGHSHGELGNRQRRLTFELSIGWKVLVQLMQVSREDGSAESFTLSGYAVHPNAPTDHVKVYYDCRSRRGTLRFTDEVTLSQ